MDLDAEIRRDGVVIPVPQRVPLGDADVAAAERLAPVAQHNALVAGRGVAPRDLVRLTDLRPVLARFGAVDEIDLDRRDRPLAGRIRSVGHEGDPLISPYG